MDYSMTCMVLFLKVYAIHVFITENRNHIYIVAIS